MNYVLLRFGWINCSIAKLINQVDRLDEELRAALRRVDEMSAENGNLRKELIKSSSQYEEAVHQFK
jgi:hypothetical protein